MDNPLRKAALLMSLMAPAQRSLMLARQPTQIATSLKSAISRIVKNGWDRREIVEAALGIRLDASSSGGGVLGMEELIGLAGFVDSAIFSRVLAAVQLPNPDFLISMLENPYAEEVRKSIETMPKLPDALRAATLASATRLLETR